LNTRAIRYGRNDIKRWGLVLVIESRDRTIRGISRKHYSFEDEPRAFPLERTFRDLD
jgi:hypothetical protein